MRTDRVTTVYTDDGIPQAIETHLRGQDVAIQKVPLREADTVIAP
jgi:hypothetical protein